MRFLRRNQPTEDRATTWVPWNVGDDVTRARSVTSSVALQHAAVWACVRLLSDVISTMPVHAFRTGSREPLDPQPPLLVLPAAYTTIGEWLEQVMVSTLTAGNTYGLITDRDAVERPTRIELLDPSRMSVTAPSSDSGAVTYRLNGRPIPRDELWIFRGLLAPGNPVGLSPISYAATAVELGLNAQDYGARWFRDESTPAGLLTTDQAMTTEQAIAVHERWRSTRGGRRGTAVLGNGLKFEPISISPEESQFLETQKFSVQQIARIFAVPPEMIGADSGSSMTYSNIESRDLSFLKYSVAPWLTRLETALTALLPADVYVKFNTGALLRTDLASRYASYAIALDHGFMSIDEVRALEDREPLTPEQRKRPPLAGVA